MAKEKSGKVVKNAKDSKKSEKVIKLTEKEFEAKVVELSKTLTSEKIGEVLRKEGIHSNDHSKKISTILKEKGSYISPDLKNIEEKLERVKSHFLKNKQDKRAMREKDRIFSQLRKTKKYLKIAVK